MNSQVNTVILEGKVLEWKVLRTTITGLPVIEGTLQYEGEVTEAERQRSLSFQVPIILIGKKAYNLSQVPVGTVLKVQGFMAPVSKQSVRFRIHVQHYDLI